MQTEAARSGKDTTREINSIRFRWHERVLADRALPRSAIAVAGVIMHRFHASRGYAEISIAMIARTLGISPRTAIRARKRLIRRNWIALHEAKTSQANGWVANRYHLTFGSNGDGAEVGKPSIGEECEAGCHSCQVEQCPECQ